MLYSDNGVAHSYYVKDNTKKQLVCCLFPLRSLSKQDDQRISIVTFENSMAYLLYIVILYVTYLNKK